MAASPLLLFLALLLLPALREYVFPSHHEPKDSTAGELHPLVLVPGASCPAIQARLTEQYQPSKPRCGTMKGVGWFGLWEHPSDLLTHDYIGCFLEQMSLVYDPAANDYRDPPGVETRVPGFGSARGFYGRDPVHPEYCLAVLRDALESTGYRDGETLFGAPYDLRHAPPMPGQNSAVYSVYFEQLMALVEDASRKNQQKKVIIFGHSMGGAVALEFVRNTPMAWRDRYIKHLILVAPTLSEGFLEPVRYLASGTDMLYVPDSTPLSLRSTWRSFESAMANLPSPAVFDSEPIVITKQRNYSANDMEDLLAAMGMHEAIEPFKNRARPRMDYFEAPLVPVTCINGVGNLTPKQLIFWESDFDESPDIVYGDGDTKVNLISILAFDEKMRQQPEQRNQFKSIKIHGAQHSNIVVEEWSLMIVVHEIHEANRFS